MWNGKPIWSTTENESIFGIDNKKKGQKKSTHISSHSARSLFTGFSPIGTLHRTWANRAQHAEMRVRPQWVPIPCVCIYISLCVIEHMWVTATCSVIILCFCFIFICASAIDFNFSSPFWTKRKNQPNSTFTYLLQINLYNKWI